MPQVTELKVLRNPVFGLIKYALFGAGFCVFTGLWRSQGGRLTYHYAREIIEGICRVENLYPSRWAFFDLRTSKSNDSQACPHEGEFEFSRLVITCAPGGRVDEITEWRTIKIPDAVLSVFLDEIGERPHQLWSPNDHRRD